MPTPYESAQLILTLYEERREEVLRKARDYFVSFDPKNFDEFVANMFSPNGVYVRMVMSYWDMATSLVNNGAIDGKMFLDSTGEFILVFGRMEPFLPQLRQMFGNPDFLKNLETFTLSIPNARQRIDTTVGRMREIMKKAAEAAASAAAKGA